MITREVPRYVAERDSESAEQFTTMLRGPEDPERSPRPKGGRANRTPHRTLKKTPVEEFVPSIRALMADGERRTFNAISVEILDLTADITCGSNFEWALWELVQAGELGFDLTAPIRFEVIR